MAEQNTVEVPQALKDKLATEIFHQLIDSVLNVERPSQIDYKCLAEIAYKATDAFYEARPNVPFPAPKLPKQPRAPRQPAINRLGSTPAGQVLQDVKP